MSVEKPNKAQRKAAFDARQAFMMGWRAGVGGDKSPADLFRDRDSLAALCTDGFVRGRQNRSDAMDYADAAGAGAAAGVARP